ncbi:glycosyltransferase family 39 protein [Candidatus Woesearchaeota archaeon]|nr:glycosyltransferase family 39 protein [Candidatus Woesearchaeota archaeon]
MPQFTQFIEKYGIWMLLGVLLFLFWMLNHLNPVLVWDENAYLANARSHLGTSYYTEDFRFPLLEYVIAGVWMVIGESQFAARLIIMFFSLSSVYLFYLILGGREFSHLKQLSYTCLFAFSPLLIIWGYKAYTDVPALFFIMLSYYFILLADENKSKYYQLLSGISLGLGILCKFPAALFAISVGIYYAKSIKKLFYFGVGIGISLLPWMLFNYYHYGNPFWDFFSQYAIVEQYTIWQSWTIQFWNIIPVLGILWLLFFFGIVYFAKQFDSKKHLLLPIIYTVIFIIYFYGITNVKLGRYYLGVLAFLYLIIIEGIEYVTDYLKNKQSLLMARLFFAVIIINSLLVFSLANYQEISRAYCQEGLSQSVSYIKDHTMHGDHVISNAWVWYGYSNNLKVNALWSTNISEILLPETKYIIIDSLDGDYFDKSILDKDNRLVREKIILSNCNREISIYRVI